MVELAIKLDYSIPLEGVRTSQVVRPASAEALAAQEVLEDEPGEPAHSGMLSLNFSGVSCMGW